MEVAAEKVGVVTPTAAVEVTAVVEAEEVRLGLAVARDVATRAAPDEATGVEAPLGGAPVDGGREQEAVSTGTARLLASARLLPRAQTTAR